MLGLDNRLSLPGPNCHCLYSPRGWTPASFGRWVSESFDEKECESLVKNECDEKGLDARPGPADRETDSDAI